MSRRVHRLATPEEQARYPNVHTFNRATGRFHNRQGFEIVVPEGIEPPKPHVRSRRHDR
jgi:hypothetical protein